jgi:hypothetical protein
LELPLSTADGGHHAVSLIMIAGEMPARFLREVAQNILMLA